MPAALTDIELDVLRFAPMDWRTTPVLRGHTHTVDALAARGLLKIRSRRSWGTLDYQITTEGLAAVWDHAPASIAHLRPEGC